MLDSLIEQLGGNDTDGVAQFIKYAICGGLATVTDMAIFYLLSWRFFSALKTDDIAVRIFRLKIKPVTEERRARNFIINTGIAFIFSNFVAYTLNALWVFEPGRHVWYIEMILFYAISLVSIAIGTALGWAMIKFMKLSTTSSYIGKLTASLLINFVCRKFIVFKG